MVSFTRKEFVDHLGEDSIKQLFPLHKIFDLVRVKLDLMLNPHMALQMVKFIELKKGPEAIYFGLTVSYWLNDKLDICGQITQIDHYSTHEEAKKYQDYCAKNQIKINQN